MARIHEPVTGAWIIVAGCLESSRSSGAGRRWVADFLGPGQIFGIMPSVDGGELQFDSTTRGDTTLLFIPRGALLEALLGDAALGLGMAQFMSRKSRLDMDRLSIKALEPLGVQIAKVLLYLERGRGLADRTGEAIPGGVTYEDMADFMGLSYQSIVAAMRPLILDGILRKRYRGVEIVDPVRLHGFATTMEPMSPNAFDALYQRRRE